MTLPRAHVACLLLAPWPLTLLAKPHPGVPVAVLGETTRRVIHANAEALAAGVGVGMRDVAALGRCPDLHAEVVTGPTARAAWAELLETLYARYSDRVEGQVPGTAFLTVSPAAARDLAAALHAPVGLAASQEVAHLAALRAGPGEVRQVVPEAEPTFLPRCPAEHLGVLGLTSAAVERLHFLGIRGLADLMGWSAGQREACLGVDGAKRINRFLRGERTQAVARHTPRQAIEAGLQLDQPLDEPAQAEVVLAELMPGLVTDLQGRVCGSLTVHADTPGGRLSGTRKLKGPPGVRGLVRLAALALGDTGALPLGVDGLTVQLSGLHQPGRLVGLWERLAAVEITREVLGRYPEALVRVRWLNPHAYVADAQYLWEDWLTGAERPTAMTPRGSWTPPTRAQRHERAVQQVLAFFEER